MFLLQAGICLFLLFRFWSWQFVIHSTKQTCQKSLIINFIYQQHLLYLFLDFIESQNNTYFFSTNIQSEQRATGSKASDGALSTRIDSSHKCKHLPTLQELTYTPILAVFQKSLLTAIPPQHTVLM